MAEIDERRRYAWLVAGVTLLGLTLRLVSLQSDLWLDEFSAVVRLRNTSVLQVFLRDFGFNNHLLNDLLVKAAVRVFGEQEWAVRLPAMLWGTATIPVLYWMTRQMMSRFASLCAALLLAMSYHHIFFSQDARGYTSYVCLSLVASGLLVKGLRTDAVKTWTGFVIATIFNFSTLLLSAFVFTSHLMVAAISTWQLPAHDGERSRAFRRRSLAFGIAAMGGLLIYGALIPQMFANVGPIYRDRSSGFSLFSMDLFDELTRGISAGYGAGWLWVAVPFLALAAAGYVSLLRRQWVLVAALTLPNVLLVAFLASLSLILYPRTFILVLPLTILVAVEAVSVVASSVTRAVHREAPFASWIMGGVVLMLCLASAAALPHYYQTPKQPYRAAVAYVEAARQPDGLVIQIQYAAGMQYYLSRAGLTEGTDYFEARTVEALDAIRAAHRGRPVWLVTTFPRALRRGVPELDARIKRDWEIDRRFQGTVGDGDIFVWKERPH